MKGRTGTILRKTMNDFLDMGMVPNSQKRQTFRTIHNHKTEPFMLNLQPIFMTITAILLTKHMHSKHISIDDDIAVIGSSNLDIRSFQLNLEVTQVCYSPHVVADQRPIEAAYLLKSGPVKLEEWETRLLREKLFENISRLTAALQ
jgi:phosphatidylserine/phosphatidylglycerophosphate/cardiolipin synthase-like enzyme